MTMLFYWFALSSIPGVVALVLVAWAVLILLAGHTAPDLAQSDNPTRGFDRTDARYWKFGFYRNPQDSALYVPKHNPTLIGINIGQPEGRRLAVSILLGIALLMAFVWAVPVYFLLLLLQR